MDFTRLTQLLDRLPARGVPGLECKVMKDGQEVYRHSAGYSCIETQTPVTGENLYFLYSASKVVTCTAALQLYERGLYLMSDPIADYLPEFKEMTVRHTLPDGKAEIRPAQNPITIGQLFTMTAGLTYNTQTLPIREKLAAEGEKCTTRSMMSAIAASPLMFEPGTRWNYSLCHDVLGAFIEVISGKTFGEYLKENVFDPCGMADTAFTLAPEKKHRMAAQYCFNEKTQKPERMADENELVFGPLYESGGAGLISSLDDYMRFANALCTGAPRLIAPRTMEMMRENHLNAVQMADFNWIQMRGYGYGLGVRTMVDRARGGSNGSLKEFGWGGAAGAYVMIDPDLKLTVVFLEHMRNSLEPYIHPRIRNTVYACL